METTTRPNGDAPITSSGANPGGTYRLGAKGGKGADAWQYVWDRLSSTDWKRGDLLAQEAATEFGLKLTSVVELLSRMRAAGNLDQKMIPVKTEYVRYGKPYTAERPRVHYRIADRVIPVEAGTYDVEMRFSEPAQ